MGGSHFLNPVPAASGSPPQGVPVNQNPVPAPSCPPNIVCHCRHHPPLVMNFMPLVTPHPSLVMDHPPLVTRHLSLVRHHQRLGMHHQPKVSHHQSLVTGHPSFLRRHQPLVTPHQSLVMPHQRRVIPHFYVKNRLFCQKMPVLTLLTLHPTPDHHEKYLLERRLRL